MKKWMRALGVALTGAVVFASPALARMSIGETRPFTMDDPAEGTTNYLLRQKFGDRYMAVGGSIARIGVNRYLLCGYSVDMHRQGRAAKPVGFVIVSDNAGDYASVLAPASQAQQEAKGCWPGERQREEAEIGRLVKIGEASKGEVTTTAPGGVGAVTAKEP